MKKNKNKKPSVYMYMLPLYYIVENKLFEVISCQLRIWTMHFINITESLCGFVRVWYFKC